MRCRPPSVVRAGGPPTCAAVRRRIDAGSPGCIFRDAAGLEPSGVNAAVRLIRDRGTLQAHCLFDSNRASWCSGAMQAINGNPVVTVTGGGNGTWRVSPFWVATNSYTVVAVWRVKDGGHPFGTSTNATLGPSGWTETLDASTPRIMPSVAVAAGDVLVAHWSRSVDASLTFSLRTPTAAYCWTRSPDTPSSWLANTTPSIRSSLDLAELLVWHTALTGATLSALSQYLQQRWGRALALDAVVGVLPDVQGAIPQPVVHMDGGDKAYLFSDTGGTVAIAGTDGNVVCAVRSKGSVANVMLSFTGGTTTYRTSLRNGRPALNFQGSKGPYNTVAFFTALEATGGTFIMVAKASTNGAHPMNNGNDWFSYSNNTLLQGFGTSTRVILPFAMGAWGMYYITASPTTKVISARAWINGAWGTPTVGVWRSFFSGVKTLNCQQPRPGCFL